MLFSKVRDAMSRRSVAPVESGREDVSVSPTVAPHPHPNGGRNSVATSDGKAGRSPAPSSLVGNTLSGSVWTIISRLTGVGKVITIGAVLGATYLGNTYQATNALPNLMYYQFLAGSLFASLLVPPLVRCLDGKSHRDAQRLASGFLGTLMLGAAGICVLGVLCGPLIVRLLSAGVANASIARAQRHVGLLLLMMFLPQVVLYAIAGTGAAVMNARGRFALAAGAPALENIGIITTLISSALIFGTSTSLSNIGTSRLLFLGIGTTASVAVHAGCQWWGAHRAGINLVPRVAWNDPDVREIMSRVRVTLAYTGLTALQIFVVMIVANRVPGGLVAFQLALNFFFLPAAVATWPIARACLPLLARAFHRADPAAFQRELSRSLSSALFLTIPVATAYVILARPLARVLSFGHLHTTAGMTLITVSLATLGLGIAGDTVFILGTYAFYARNDVRPPLRSMVLRVAISFVGMAIAMTLHGPAVLIALGLSLSVAATVGALHLCRNFSGFTVPSDCINSVLHTIAASLVMAVPMILIAVGVTKALPSGAPASGLATVTAAIAGALVFLGLQSRWGAPEIGSFKRVMVRFLHRTST
ncbi:MAG: putative peptidoglycan lipid flippase [Actinomycetota bacterium]|jgi:putative peptidoglycan lipid II flippase|nr:putative peptidoglycan lipid flippase [Actinomycetota bacterium]